jgi:hypothetical protein
MILYAGEIRFTLRIPTPAVENSGVNKARNSTWSKKEVLWNESALFYKLFCTKKGYIRILTHDLKLTITPQRYKLIIVLVDKWGLILCRSRDFLLLATLSDQLWGPPSLCQIGPMDLSLLF